MLRISLLVWIIGITAVNTRRLNRLSELLSSTELVITAHQSLGKVYIDGQTVVLTNASNWRLTDRIVLPPTSRLIALEGLFVSGPPCAGILASVNDTYLVTNNLWKCSADGYTGWTDLGYDDSSWPPAVEYGSNGNHVTCTEQIQFTDISSSAQWIWANDPDAFIVYCRGYLPLCQTASPCLNGGTCLSNEKRMCDCTPQYTGTYCESSLITTATTAATSIAETTLSSTTSAPSTTALSTTETTSKSPTTPTVTTPVVSTTRSTTNLPSTTTTTSQPLSSTTTVATKASTTLFITVYQQLRLLYIDNIEQPLINGNTSNQPDSVELTATNRLIAVRAAGDKTCGGLLASIGDAYVLTDGNWKCNEYQYKDWERLGYNDSWWPYAFEFGRNADGHTKCSNLQNVPGISGNAKWIWVSDQTEQEIFCRGYIPVCDNSPCQNNGTCQLNNKTLCRCTPQFTGTYCETEILASTTKMTIETTTQEQATKGISTNNLQTTEVTTQPQTTEETTQSQTTEATRQHQTTEVTTQPQTTEVTTHLQTTEVTTQTQTMEVTTQPHTTEVTTQPQTTEVTTQPRTTEVTTQPQTTKVTTHPQTTEMKPQPQTTEVTTEPQTTKVTTQPQTTEVKPQPQTTEVTTESHTTKVTTQPQTTEVTTRLQTTEVTTLFQATKDITTNNPETIEVTTEPQTTNGITTNNRQTTQKTTVMETTHGITTASLQTTDPPTTDAAATPATTTTIATAEKTSIAETTLSSANGVPSTVPTTAPSTTASITHPQTTEGITTVNRQTTHETTLAETTRGITTDSLQTTDPPTTEAAATTAATSVAETILSSTSGVLSTTPSSTASSTTETTSKSPTTPNAITPVVSTSRSTTNLPSTTTTTSRADPGNLVSTDPPDLPICTTDEYCNGPFEKPGASIEHCACPADFLNVNNNCCMSQNWIIGLTCLCVAILLLIFIIIIVCICQSDDSHSSIGDSVSLVDSDRLGDDGHSMDVSIVSETKIESHKKPGVMDAHGVKDDVLQASADGHFAAEKSRDGQEIRRRSRELVGPGSNTLRGLNPSGLHPLTQQPIYTLGRRRGQPEYRSMIEGGRREDFFYNPLMVEMLSNDIYRRFRPNMSAIPTNVDYSIQRPEIELEFLYNELYGSELPPGMYDYNSPWNMNMRP